MRRLFDSALGLWTVGASVAWLGAWLDYPDTTLAAFGIPALLFLAVGTILTLRVR